MARTGQGRTTKDIKDQKRPEKKRKEKRRKIYRENHPTRYLINKEGKVGLASFVDPISLPERGNKQRLTGETGKKAITKRKKKYKSKVLQPAGETRKENNTETKQQRQNKTRGSLAGPINLRLRAQAKANWESPRSPLPSSLLSSPLPPVLHP